MRCLLMVLLLTLSGLRPALAGEATDQTAADVVAAYESGDMDALREVARSAKVDPWLVADKLCRSEACKAALVYARAIERQDTARLPAYLEKRRNNAHDTALRAVIEAVRRANTGALRAAALALLEAQRGRGDAYERVLVEFARGELLSTQKRSTEASEAYGRAGQDAERLGWLRMAAHCYRLAGIRAQAEHGLEAMLRAWMRLLSIEQARANPVGVGRALVYVGNVHAELGDYDRCLPFLKQADGVFARLGDAARQAWVQDSIGEVLQRRGQYSMAQRVLQNALANAKRAKYPYRIAHVLTNLGGLYSKLFDFERVLKLHRRALAIFETLKNPAGIAQATGNIGIVHGKRGELGLASEFLGHALRMYRDLDSRAKIAVALVSLSEVVNSQQRPEDARTLLAEALGLARSLRDEYLEANVLLNQGTLFVGLREFTEASKALALAMQISVRLASSRLLMESHRRQAELLYAQKKYARAFHAAELAFEYTLAMQTGLAPDSAAGARDSLAELFEVHIGAAAAWGRSEAVFAAIEGARAGALLEVLENRDAIKDAYIPDKLDQRQNDANRALRDAARAYQRAVRLGDRGAKRKALRVLDQKRASLQGVIADIQREARAAASVLFPVAMPMEDAQEALSKGEALVLYSLIGASAVALVVTADDARIVPLGSRKWILTIAGAEFSDPTRDATADIVRLRKALVKPLKLPKTVRRVLIAPDGILGYVPFALLVGDRDVVYVPSATAYGALRASEQPAGSGILALGDPEYRVKPPKADVAAKAGKADTVKKAGKADSATKAGKAGTTTKAGKDGGGVAPPPLERGGMRLRPLPGTRKEVTSIGGHADDLVLLGPKATRGRFLMAVKTRERWRAIHLACHGILDTERPMRSGLALALDKEGRSLLTCADVFQNHLPADLAVLSACNTGRGKLHYVEGIVGLTQAFMLAGSPRVLVRLWKVDDEATLALMLKFYELWNPRPQPGEAKGADGTTRLKKTPLSTARALRLAQAHVRSQKKWRHPYYWAAWVLWGLPD